MTPPPPASPGLRTGYGEMRRRHASPGAAQIYAEARVSGKDHPHAIRILARAWIRVIWPCWISRIPYAPGKRGAAAALMGQAEE